MRSDITPAMQAAFEGGTFKAASVIALHFSTPIFLTDNSFSINIGINTYLPVQGEMVIPNLTSSMQNEKGTITIELPNTDRVFDSIIESDGFVDKWVNLGVFLWDKDDNELGYLELWSGQTTKPETNEKSVKISAASHHSIFEQRNGIKTTPASHSRMLKGLNYSDRDVTFWWAGKIRQFKLVS